MAATVSESLTVTSSLTVTGIPATISYGSVDPGLTSGTQAFTAAVTGNSGWSLDVTSTGFSASGGKTISLSQRDLQIVSATGGTTTAVGTWTAFGVGSLASTTPEASGPTGSSGFDANLRVRVPAAAQAGAYTATVTFTFTAV